MSNPVKTFAKWNYVEIRMHYCMGEYSIRLHVSYSCSTKRTFFQNFPIILKRSLQNYRKDLKKCFVINGRREWMMREYELVNSFFLFQVVIIVNTNDEMNLVSI